MAEMTREVSRIFSQQPQITASQPTPNPLSIDPRLDNNVVPAVSAERRDIGGVNAQFGWPESCPSTITSGPQLPQQVHSQPQVAESTIMQSLRYETVSALDLPAVPSTSSASPTTLDQEWDSLMEDKSNNSNDNVSSSLLAFYLDNLHEYELGQSAPIVKGRLKAHVSFWVNISAPQWVLDTINFGYAIPFSVLPVSVTLPNNKSAVQNSSFVSQAISDLLSLGLIVELSSPPFVVNPLSVSFNSQRSPRLILDLRHVNKCIPKTKFRMEDWKTFINYFVPNGFAFKFDFKSGYHHVDICHAHQKFLGFQWPLNSSTNRYFCFTVLPFGLSSAPYLFTKLFRPLVKLWRSKGFHVVLYLDDGISCEKNLEVANSVSKSVRDDLIMAGVVPNRTKSVWDPVQKIEWLGLLWDFAESTIAIPQSRLDNLLATLDQFRSRLPVVSPRFIASLVGKIISLSPVVGNVALLLSRFLQSAIQFRDHWDSPFDLSCFQFHDQCIAEIDFWSGNLLRINNRFLFSYNIPAVIIHSDASVKACGGHAFFVDGNEFELYFQAFSSREIRMDSNGRELLGILYGLKSFKSHLSGKVVKFFTDNRNVAIITRKGSTSLRLHRLALDIFSVLPKLSHYTPDRLDS